MLIPGLPTKPGSPELSRGARIKLRTPAGKETETFIKELVMISYRKRPEKICIPILLPKDVTKEEVPVGTEVLLIEENHETVTKQEV